MTTQEEFEVWYGENYSTYALKSWDGINHYENLDTDLAWVTWQSAKQETAKEIAELHEYDLSQKSKLITQKITINELQSQVNTLRDLLERAQNGLYWYQDSHPGDSSEADNEIHEEINKALSNKLNNKGVIMRVRKKPVEVEALLWNGSKSDADKIIQWMGCGKYIRDEKCNIAELHIPTLEDGFKEVAKHAASAGDWIIKGVKGEFYPCKPDIFEQTYEILGD